MPPSPSQPHPRQSAASLSGRAKSVPAPESPAPTPLGDLSRDIVLRRIASQAHKFPELDLADLDTSCLDGPQASLDSAFAHAVYDAVIRRWITLAFLIDRRLSVPLGQVEPRVRAALLAGAAQILFLDRVPAHAAINHAVEWTKIRVHAGAGGMVNAVLRRIAELRQSARPKREAWSLGRDELPLADGSCLVLPAPVLPEDRLDRISIATSTPRPLLEAWSALHPPDLVASLAYHSIAAPPTILNTAHADPGLPLPSTLSPHSLPGSHVFSGAASELTALLRSRSDIWVQDPASSLAVRSIRDREPSLVLDLCAGLGTKTRQLAATFSNARILATDVDRRRLETLRSVFAGSRRVEVVEPSQIRDRAAGLADLVVLDVPCSNTGVLARRPEARYRYSPDSLGSLLGVQRQIIADSLPMLRTSRGAILYATCSLEPQENSHQAAWAGQWHGLRPALPDGERLKLPSGGPGKPSSIWADGSFSVVLGHAAE